MIRYFPGGVDIQRVKEMRQILTRSCQQSPETIQCRAASVRRCLCSERYPIALPLLKCPLKDASKKNTLGKILKLKKWTDLPFGLKVELMMQGGHPVLSALHSHYSCPEIHLVFTLCPDPYAIRNYLRRQPQKNLFLKDSMGNTAFLLLVASPCTVDVIAEALDRLGVNAAQKLVGEENCEGMTPLHFAVLKGNAKLVDLLLGYGADANAGAIHVRGQRFGITPFHLSLLSYSKPARDCFQTLMVNDADASIEVVAPRKDTPGAAAFRFECHCGGCWSAPVRGFEAVLPKNVIGKEKSVSIGAALNILAVFRDRRSLPYFRTLLQSGHGLNVDLTDHRGMTPLAHAMMAGDLDLIPLLVATGADINCTSVVKACVSTKNPLELAESLAQRASGQLSVGEKSFDASAYSQGVAKEDVGEEDCQANAVCDPVGADFQQAEYRNSTMHHPEVFDFHHCSPEYYPHCDMNYRQGGDKYPQGGVNYLLGGVIYPQGGVNSPQGGVNYPQGGVNYPQGGINYPQGGVNYPQGGVNYPQGTMYYPQGGVIYPQGGVIYPQGGVNYLQGTMYYPQGGVNYLQGTMYYPQGGVNYPQGGNYLQGTMYYPQGTGYGDECAVNHPARAWYEGNEVAPRDCAVGSLQRIRQLDHNTCPWCLAQLP